MGDQGIDLGSLSAQQLEGLKDQLEGELDQFAESFQQLQAAANRFHVSGIAAESLSQEQEGAFPAVRTAHTSLREALRATPSTASGGTQVDPRMACNVCLATHLSGSSAQGLLAHARPIRGRASIARM
jgi:hypothetical protein